MNEREEIAMAFSAADVREGPDWDADAALKKVAERYIIHLPDDRAHILKNLKLGAYPTKEARDNILRAVKRRWGQSPGFYKFTDDELFMNAMLGAYPLDPAE